MLKHTAGVNRKSSWKGGNWLRKDNHCMGCMGPRKHQNWCQERGGEAEPGSRERHAQHKRGCLAFVGQSREGCCGKDWSFGRGEGRGGMSRSGRGRELSREGKRGGGGLHGGLGGQLQMWR